MTIRSIIQKLDFWKAIIGLIVAVLGFFTFIQNKQVSLLKTEINNMTNHFTTELNTINNKVISIEKNVANINQNYIGMQVTTTGGGQGSTTTGLEINR